MSTCRSCGAPVEWVRTERGRQMPVEPCHGGNVLVDRDLFGRAIVARVVTDTMGDHVSHFSVCPQAAAWRRGKR